MWHLLAVMLKTEVGGVSRAAVLCRERAARHLLATRTEGAARGQLPDSGRLGTKLVGGDAHCTVHDIA